MSNLPLLNNESTIRNRRAGVGNIVKEFDVFMKISDDVKEKPQAAKGILTIVSFTLIFFLLVGQLYEYFTNEEVKYKFLVDTEYDQILKLDIDMIVATPCSLLEISPMRVELAEEQTLNLFNLFFGDENSQKKKHFLEKNPTRFEMNNEELQLWNILQKVHQEHFKPGTPLKPVNEKTFVDGYIQQELLKKADKKQKQELNELAQLQKKEEKNDNNVVFVIGNGFSVFQIIASNNEMGSLIKDEGTACRIKGQIPVLKGTGDQLKINIGKSIGFGNIVAHFNNEENSKGNLSHRIERFHFGPQVWGLVTPLVGKEEIVNESGISFQYFIKVVPTKIYSLTSNMLFNRPDITYQYSVTYGKKEGVKGKHTHDSIVFEYEFSEIIVEVWPVSISFVQLILRMCSIIGGIFATSRLIEILLSSLSFFIKMR